jgi:hypothetical protein
MMGVAVLPAGAKSYPLTDQKITLTAPDSWVQSTSTDPTAVLVLHSPDGMSYFVVTAKALNPMLPMEGLGTTGDQAMVKGLVTNNGGTSYSGYGHATLGGVDFIGFDFQVLDPNTAGSSIFGGTSPKPTITASAWPWARKTSSCPRTTPT